MSLCTHPYPAAPTWRLHRSFCVLTYTQHLGWLQQVRVLDGEVLRRLVLHERQVLWEVGVREDGDRVQHVGRVVAVGQLHPHVVRHLQHTQWSYC